MHTPPFRPPTPGPTPPATLERLWEHALNHLYDAAREMAAAETDARHGHNERDPELTRQAEWRLNVAGINAMIGHGYAAMAQAAATGLNSERSAERSRWQQLAGPVDH